MRSGRSRDSPLPMMADIHFDHRLALAALEAGADKIRINPGNLGGAAKTRIVVEACRERGVSLSWIACAFSGLRRDTFTKG